MEVNQLTRRIDKMANFLIDDFYKHLRDYRAEKEPDADQRVVFEGWAIQKLAALLVGLEDVSNTVALLANSSGKRKGN